VTSRADRALELFQRAGGLDPSARDRLLDRECGGDPELRRAVEALFEDDETVGPPSGSRAPVPIQVEDQTEDLISGELFAGRYRIVSVLGRGAMGVVYRAHDTVLDVEVAVKLLIGRRPDARERMIREVRLAREVTHPAVCRVFDVGQDGDRIYLTMEYVDGEDLSTLSARIGRLPSDKVLEIAHQLCGGLAAAHAKGVIHRDLKPANVMVDSRGTVRITDFGIAVSAEEAGTDGFAGTPAYMAPEQFDPDAPIGPATDIYAVGLILHELLTGQRLFTGSSFTEMFRQKVRTTPTRPSDTVDGVDPRLEAVIMSALSRAPRDRPESVLAMSAGLPGGDPLALAVEAGALPKPELVAAATTDTALGRVRPVVLLMLLGGLLVGVLAVSNGPWLDGNSADVLPPQALADRSSRLLAELEKPSSRDGEEWGFVDNVVAADPLDRVLFWYRRSRPRTLPPFVRRAFDASALVRGIDVPPVFTHEQAFVMLEPTGDLVYLNAGVPFGSRVGGAATVGETSRWRPLFEAAGLDAARMVPETGVEVPVLGDLRGAWASAEHHGSRTRVRVQATALEGNPVYFATQSTDPGSEAREGQLRRRLWLGRWVRAPLYLLLVVLALGLGVHSVIRERSDLRGAAVVAVVLLGVGGLGALVTAGHVVHPLASTEMTVLGQLLDIVVGAIAVGLCYIGLEPLVRRHRPQALIAWTRLLAGSFANRAVGLSLLVGSLAGAIWAVIHTVDRVLVQLAGLNPTWGWLGANHLNASVSLGTIVGTVLREVEGATVGGLLAAVLFAVVTRPPVRPAVGWIGFSAIVAVGYGIDAGAHLPLSVVTVGVAVGVVALVLLHSFGLLSLVTAMLCSGLLTAFPITLDRSQWYAQGGFFAVAMVLTVGLVGALLMHAGGSRVTD
jgi:serine/threonine-protein kinase